MLGERSDQRGLWEADRLYLDHVGRESFYGLLASMRGRLFRDADFAEFYCPDNGRDSVPPSLLATALLLQSHDKVSDAEAKARADFDLWWKVALGIEAEDRPFAKSTLQVFRAQLILHDKVREVFESSLRLARESGCLKGRGMRVALDTTNILGRGAVKDTYNLLADGIVKLLRALAAVEQAPVREWGGELDHLLPSRSGGSAGIPGGPASRRLVCWRQKRQVPFRDWRIWAIGIVFLSWEPLLNGWGWKSPGFRLTRSSPGHPVSGPPGPAGHWLSCSRPW